MANLKEKIRDWLDSSAYLSIVCRDSNDIAIIREAMLHTDINRIRYETIFDSNIRVFNMVAPHNRYIEFLRQLRLMGWNIESYSEVGIICKLTMNE